MQELIYILAGFFIALAVTVFSIPPIVILSRKLNLLAVPNGRSATLLFIPNLGGIAIFLGFVLGVTLTCDGYFIQESIYIFTAGLIMFFVGLHDDTVTLSAKKRLIAEIFISLMLIFWGDFRITNLHGFLGIETISIYLSTPLTIFVYIVIINSINLVDGIDGLAAGLTSFSASVLGVWFFLSGHSEFAIFSFALAGGLLGFLLFNLYGKENKIFMGDTGSLVVGTIIAVLVIQFNEFNINQAAPYAISAAPAVSFGLLIYPLLDTLRVFMIRIIQKKSPFTADKNHCHHRLLALRMTHREATYMILVLNALFTALIFYYQEWGITRLMIFNLVIGAFYILMPSYILSTKFRIPNNDQYQQIILFSNQEQKTEKKKEHFIPQLLSNTISEQLKRISIW